MRLLHVVPAVVLLISSGVAGAHAHLRASSPASGAQLKYAPRELSLDFSEAAQLTALSLARAGGAPQKLTAPATPATHVTITLPALTPGTWTVSFRALSADGHLVPGTVTFTLTP
jgi:methionine-rich copper-binding protein CopC